MKVEKGNEKMNERVQARRIVFLLSSDLILLDLAGPWDVFEAANVIATQHGGTRPYELESVSISGQKEIRAEGGLTLRADRSCAEFVGAVDTLVVCGARGMHNLTPDQVRTPEMLRLVKKARRVASVCVGAFFLAALGVLDGRRVTTHWLGCEQLEQCYPKVTVELNSIFVQDGKVFTSAGVTAGIDLAPALVEADLGQQTAKDVARRLVVPIHRSGGQTQYSSSLNALSGARASLTDLMKWAQENPRADLSVEALANKVGMSERNFSRVFKSEVGQTPAEFVDKLRVDLARNALEETGATLEDVAKKCGLNSADSMRRVFLRVVKVTPSAYRSRFRN